MRKTMFLIPIVALVVSCAMRSGGPDVSRSNLPPESPAVVTSGSPQLPLPSPAADALRPPPPAPEVVLPEVLPTVNPPDVSNLPVADATFGPALVNPSAFQGNPPVASRVIELPELNLATAEELADALDRNVQENEAAVIRVFDRAGNLLASRERPRTTESPAAGTLKQLEIFSAYQVDATGRICPDARGDPLPAANAAMVGTLEVSNACANQNVRIVLEGLRAFVVTIN